jgi:hypothetical protein
MTTATAKMIYADKQIANAILGKLSEAIPDAKYDLFKLPVGWQIVRVKKMPDYMPPAKPIPVKESATNFLIQSQNAEETMSGGVIKFLAKVQRETSQWVYFKEPVGPIKAQWLHKSHIISQGVAINGEVMISVSHKIAKDKLGYNLPANSYSTLGG